MIASGTVEVKRMSSTSEATMAYLTREPIDPSEWRQQPSDPADGAVVEFRGIVRGVNHGRPVRYLEYQAYEPMAEAVLADLERQARERWGVRRVAICHRIGRVEVGETSVAIMVESPHRQEAFDACRFLIDRIKQEAPIWKREHYADGSVEYGACEHVIRQGAGNDGCFAATVGSAPMLRFAKQSGGG